MEEPWGLNDDEPKYQPTIEDITDDESDLLIKTAGMNDNDIKEPGNCSEYSTGRRKDPYRCDRCEFATGDFMNFITHKNAHMEKEKNAASLFTCGMCEFATPNPKHMAEHIQKHLDQPDKTAEAPTPTTVDADEDETEMLEKTDAALELSPGNPSDSEPPLLITEVKSAAKSSEDIEQSVQDLNITQSDQREVKDNSGDLAEKECRSHSSMRDSEVGVHSTIEVTSLPVEDDSDIVIKENLDPEISVKSASPIEINPMTSLALDEKLVDNAEPPLNWVSVAEAQEKNSKISSAASEGVEDTNDIADNSLIGYLELRRIKPIVPLPPKPLVLEKIKEHNVSEVIPKKKPKIEEDIEYSAVVETIYQSSDPTLVKYTTDKKKVVATDKGVKTVKPTPIPVNHASRSASYPKQLPEKIKLPAKTKMPRSRNSSRNTPTQTASSPTRSLSSRSASLLNQNANGTVRSTRSMGLPTENQKSNSSKMKCPKSQPGSQAKQQAVAEVSQVRTRASSKPEEEPGAPVRDAQIQPSMDTDNKVCVNEKPSDITIPAQLQSVSETATTKEEEQYSSVYLRLHKKPKRDFLLRYQSEMSRESLPSSPEPNEEQLNVNKVIDIIAPAYLASTKFQGAKEVMTKVDSPAVEETTARDFESGHSCKIVLSRCSVIDHMGSAPLTPKIALKLKSSLRDCWKKVIEKSSSPNDEASVCDQEGLLHEQNSDSRKRKLLLSEEDSLKSQKKISKVYRCEFCEYSTDSKHGLFSHSHERHTEEEKMYICDKCDYITSRHSKLIYHTKTHQLIAQPMLANRAKVEKNMNGTESSYDPCKAFENFPADRNLNWSDDKTEARDLNSDGEKLSDKQEDNCLLVCKFCPFRTCQLTDLQAHEKSHNKANNRYKCKHCNFSSPRWGQYLDHQLQSHKSKSELSCYDEQCEFTTSNPEVLKSHRLLHKVIPQHICEQCGYTTFRQDFFDKHCGRHHSGDTSISNKLKLRYQTSTTPKEQPFKCVICWYSARDSKTLAKHMQIHATKAHGKFLCDTCKFTTNSKFVMNKHLKNSKKCEQVLNKVDS